MNQDAEEAAETLRQIEHYRQDFRRRTQSDDRFIYAVLAATYLIGFGGQFLITAAWPQHAAKTGIVLAIVGSLTMFIILAHSYRHYQGVRGTASAKPTYFGIAWLISLIVVLAATTLISTQIPQANVARIAYPMSVVMIGLIYAFAGVFVSSRRELYLGCWLIGVGVLAAMLPEAFMLLTLALLPACGFAVCALRAHPDASDDA